jgi:selenide, water dikinase
MLMCCLHYHSVDNILMLIATSLDMPSDEIRHIVTQEIMLGFHSICQYANTIVTGGQTVKNPWPIIGGVAISVVQHDRDIIYPDNAREEDVLVLTKPLGTQIAVNAKQWLKTGNKQKYDDRVTSQGITDNDVLRAYHYAVRSMIRLNYNAALLMHKYQAHCATDVTGFGIYGHADNLCRNQKESLDFTIHTLPIIKHMSTIAKKSPGFRLLEGHSAETSGGLLISMSRQDAEQYINELRQLDVGWDMCGWIIGDVKKGNRTVTIDKNVKIIDV